LISFVISSFRSRMSLQVKILALQHQLSVYKHSKKRPKIKLADRIFWIWLSKVWSDCFDHLVFVKPDTLIRWQRKRFRDHWTKLSRKSKPGRDKVAKEIV
jgi:putative transposase